MSSDRSDAFRAAFHFKVLWDECVQQYAATFLNRAIGPETTLRDVVSALSFLTAKGICSDDLRLRDAITAKVDETDRGVYRRQSRARRTDAVEKVVASGDGRSSWTHETRTVNPAKLERNSEDVERLKTQPICRLVGTLEPQTTVTLWNTLRSSNADVGMSELQLVLESLHREGRIVHDSRNAGGWVFRPQVRTQLRRMVVKKAHTNLATSALSQLPTAPLGSQSVPENMSTETRELGEPLMTSE